MSKTMNEKGFSTMEVNAIKVDMESTWAKEVLIPSLEYLKKGIEPWTMIKAPLEYINLFKGQRELKRSFLNIVREFDYRRVDVKSLNFKDGYLDCWDGHHTIEALKAKGYKYAWFRLFYNLDLEEEAYLFVNQSKNVTRLSPADSFNCQRQLELDPAKSILEVCDKYNVTVGGRKGSLRNVTAPRKLVQIYNDCGKEGVDYSLGIIELSGWADKDSKAYVEAALNIGYQAYKMFKGDVIKTVKLTEKLKTYENSSAFIDAQRKKYKDVSAKHPEDCMRLFVADVTNNK